MNSIPDLGVEIPEISQIGFVVEDLEDGMDRFGGLLGVGPWNVYEFEPPTLHDTTFRGEARDQSMTLALAYVGDTMIELIEPKEGESLYTEHLAEHGEGLHHVACFAFEDPEAVIAAFEENGMPVVQSGIYHETPYWYLDTADQLNGVLLEIVTNLEAAPDPDRQYP